MADGSPLTRIERLALRFGELANETPRGKWLQTRFLRGVLVRLGARDRSRTGCSSRGSTT